MRINYQFFKNFNRRDVLELEHIGIKVDEGCDAFVVYEDEEKFELVKKYFGEKWKDKVTVIDTDFTEKERNTSAYLSIATSKMLGYPQPEEWDEDEGEKEPAYPFNIYPYFENVFEVANTSRDYGMLRGTQTGDFSLLGEPKWGKSNVGSIFWCGDALFSTPDIYKKVFAPLGIKSRTVLGYGNQKPLTTIVQLLPQGISDSKLIFKPEQIGEPIFIPEWNITKYTLYYKGFFPSFEKHPGKYDFFVSQEYFGSGGVNEKTVFISQKLYQLLKENNVKGLEYYPQESSSEKSIEENRQENYDSENAIIIRERRKRGKMIGGHILLDPY